QRPRALHPPVAREAAEDPRGRPDPCARSRVRGLGADHRIQDRLPYLSAVPDHRHDHLGDADVDGDDDAAPGPHLAAVQDPAVRAGRRVAPRHPVTRDVLPLTRRPVNQDTITHLSVQAMEITLKVSAPFLLAGLAVGLLVSIFQAATSIQEQTLTFIPKIVVTGIVVVVGGPWMLDQLVGYTQALFLSIPTLVTQ